MTDINIVMSFRYYTPIILYTVLTALFNIGFINIYNLINYIWKLCKIEYILLTSALLNIMFIFILSNKLIISITCEKK